jgi:DNA-binding MarR family transcriptional regulator
VTILIGNKAPKKPRLNYRQRLVLLAFFVDNPFWNCVYPSAGYSLSKIATISGLSEETVSEILLKFYKNEWIERYMSPKREWMYLFNEGQVYYLRHLLGISDRPRLAPKREHYI